MRSCATGHLELKVGAANSIEPMIHPKTLSEIATTKIVMETAYLIPPMPPQSNNIFVCGMPNFATLI